MQCRFDESKLIRAYALYLKSGSNRNAYEPNQQFIDMLDTAFVNPESAAKAVEDLVRKQNNVVPTGSPAQVQNVELTGNYRRSQDSENIASYYVGDSGYRRMISRFRKDILGASILEIDLNNGKFRFFDSSKIVNPNLNVSQLQSNLLFYKQRLINNLLKAINPASGEISLSESMDDYSFTKTVDDVIAMFEEKLSDTNRSEIEANGYYDDYVILKNFDRLIERFASYITIDNSYRKSKWEGVKKYNLTPKVNHYKGISKDEGVDISKQISDLAETILKVVPEVNANGNIIPDSSIGVDGFNGSMMTLKKALLYSQNLGENSSEYRKAYSKGSGALINNFDNIIQDFITNNSTAVQGKSEYSDFRQLYLHNKLRGIAKFLMSKDAPADIRNMFAQMFVKTEPTTYRVYSYDGETGLFSGKDLKSRMLVTQKRAIQNVITSGIKAIQNGTRKVASDLAKKYYINISENNGVETVNIVNNDTNQTMEISYSFDKKGEITGLTIDDGDTIFEDMLRDFYAYVIPDTYASCVAEEGYDWRNDFAPFIVLAAKEIKTKLGDTKRGQSINIGDGKNINLSLFDNSLLKIGRRLGVIYGDSVHNTVRNLNGNNLPLFQLTSLEYNWRMCLDDAKAIEYENPMQFNIFWDNEDLLSEPQRRSEIAFNGQVKSPARLNLEELMKLSIIDDFLFPYLHEDTIYFQNTTFSDKTTHFLPGFKTKLTLKGDTFTEIFGRDKTLKDVIDDAIKNGSGKIVEWGRRVQMGQTGQVLDNILHDYAEVFGWNDVIPKIGDYNDILKCAKRLDERLKDIDIQSIRDAFAVKHVNFREEIHATESKVKGLGKTRLNETMLAIFEASADSKLWQARTERDRIVFKDDLKNTKLFGFTPGMMDQIDAIRKIKGIDHSKFYNEILHEYNLVSKDGNLNPIAEVYFALDQILSNQFNTLTVGDFWAHANKNKDKDINNYLVYSEANRFVNQIKRNVIFGSTIHSFAQGIKNDEGYEIGVTPEINIAIIKDQDGLFYTPAGIDTKGDAQDGCGWCTALQAILENNSLVDAKVGDNKKTIVHDIDHQYGAPTLLKWAVYSLTNSVRRNGKQSISSVEDLVYRMYNIRFDKPLDFDLNQDYQSFKSKNGAIHIYDLANCVYKEIARIQKNVNNTYQAVYTDGTTSKPIMLNTLYNVDQLFGGAWTFDKNPDGTYSGNEASSYILAEIACKYNLRDKQIAYAVNASGCKVGATNINTKETWTDNRKALRSYKISTKYAGAMMNADHELDMAEVTEMSQMISALVEEGYYTDIVTNIYKEIGEIAINNAKTQKYIKAVDEGDRSKIAELLGKSLLASFQTGNKDTIGLAQAFIKKFDSEFKKAKLEGKAVNYIIPFSDPTIFGAFVADITSRFNKDAIRRKYEGFAGIMNPSYNMMQYYRNGNGEVKLFQQFNEECKAKLEPIIGVLPDNYTDWVELAKSVYLPNNIRNPFIVPYNSKNDIDFEDTVIIYNSDGSYQEIYINTQEKYDLVKHLMNLDDITVYNHTARPKNLRGTNTTFTVQGVDTLGVNYNIGTYSLYDIDSVRAALYISKGIKDNDPYADVKRALVTKVCGTIIDPKQQLAYCNSLTQKFLEKLDNGKVRTATLNRGENADFSNAVLGHNEVFGLQNITNPITYYATDYNVRPAEIIIGRYQFDKLGLTDQDHIWQIKDSKYFFNKLANQFEQPLLAVTSNVGAKAYDRVLYHKGQQFLVKVGNITHGEDGLKETKCLQNNVVGDDLRWESEVILTNESDNENYFDKFKFTYLEDSEGHKYPVITVQSWDDLEELSDSSFFEDFYRKNAHGRKGNDIELEEQARLAKLAETKFEAFQEALKFVGARIPTQAMQSFIPANVIAVTDSRLNATYFPVSGMLIEGADLDGDKIFLLTCTLLNNGIIQSGSALQKQLGYKTASQLLKGKGTTFQVGENGYPIDGTILAQFLVPTEQWNQTTKDNFVYYANKLIAGSITNGYTDINFVKPEGIDDELFNKQVEKFLKLLNKHSKTKSYIKDSLETLKSRVFSGIRTVTLGAQSQMKAQITVDSCTEEFKDKAVNTVQGKTEKTISPRIPSSKFQMQVQGILGKSVVGIGAVSLKTYFILCTAYNRKVGNIINELTSGNYSIAENILKTLQIINPFNGELTTLAGTNIDKILELENKIGYWEGKQLFFDTVKTMKINSSRLPVAESLSAIVSLSADNMKDLALPKLNATEDLVDIYTTAFMIGIPFKDISDIMTSPVFTMLTEAGKNNIFDSYTDKLRVKDLITEFVLNPKNNNISRRLSKIAERYTNSSGESLPNDWYFNNNLVEKIIYEFTRKDGIINSTVEFAQYDDESEELDDNGNPVAHQTILKNDTYNMYRYLLFLHKRNELLHNNPRSFNTIQKLEQFLGYVEEMSTLGRQASINQGLKTNITDYYNFANNMESFINRRLPKDFEKFSFTKFLMDEDYRQRWINYGYNKQLGFIKGFNILEALSLSPNFFNMSKLVPTVSSLLETSQTYNISVKAADYFKDKHKTFSENDFKETARYIQDLRIFDFLKNSDFELDLDLISEITKRDLEIYMTPNSLDRSSVKKLKLNSALNLASFKLLMETTILPYLKSKYGNNNFIRDLLIQENSRTKIDAEALPIPMMNIDRDESLNARYTKYLQDFNAIANTSFAGVKIGDLFFLYNLLVNKNQFGQLSFTRIFEDLINNKDVPKYISEYYKYCSSLEGSDTIYGFNLEHLAYRLNKYSKGTKIESNINTNNELPPDLTLDLPFLSSEYNLFDVKQNKYHWSPIETLDPGDAIDALVNALNKTGQKIAVITDEDVKEYNLPTERGFIKDGVICINKSRFNDTTSLLGVAVHELSHAILAGIKTSGDEIKQKYYTVLDSLKNDPEFEAISVLYPDRVGSDLLEEVFCNKLEKLLTNKINQNSKVELAIVDNGLLLKGLQTLFKSDNIQLEDGLFKPITQLFEFASTIFNFDNPIRSDYTLASQKLAELKTRLFNSKEDNFKLKQVCE